MAIHPIEQQYLALFDALPGYSFLVNVDAPVFTILAASRACQQQTGALSQTLIGKGIVEALSQHPSLAYPAKHLLVPSFLEVMATGKAHQLPIDRLERTQTDGRLTEKYLSATNSPVLSPEGAVVGIIHTVDDRTGQVMAERLAASHGQLEQAFHAIRDSEARYRELVTASSSVSYRMNADWSLMLELQGRGVLADALAPTATWLDTYIPAQQQLQVKAAVYKALESQTVFELKHEVIKLDGSTGYSFSRAVPIRDAEGNILEWFGAASDITHRKTAEEALNQNEAKYRQLFESMDQGFCVVEMIFDTEQQPVNYRFLEVNPVFEEQTGLVNATGKTANELVPNLEKHWFNLYGSVATTGQPVRFTEGSAVMGRWFDVYAFRIGDDSSRTIAVLFTDISDRRKSEQALLEKDRHLQNIIHSAPVPMLVLRGEDMVVDMINERMQEMIGKTYPILGKPLLQSIPELEGQPDYERFLTVLKTGKEAYGNERLVPLMRDGVLEERYFNFAYTPVFENGKIVGVMDAATEVTEQVLARRKIEAVVKQRTIELEKVNEALLQSNTELQRSNANLEEFAHAASHDLKEPVRKIYFFTTQLRDQLNLQLNEVQAHAFGRIQNAAERMANLIDDLLLYSHVSQRPHEAEPVDLEQKLHRVLEDLELDIDETGASVEIGKLPIVNGYGRQLQQLFQNLLSNALKYRKAGVPPRIAISNDDVIEQGKVYHRISVKDNGIGFDQQYANKIFQMFTRLHGKAEYSGTGVGLSIVKKVVENHNGLINVESTPGTGSQFMVYLPAS